MPSARAFEGLRFHERIHDIGSGVFHEVVVFLARDQASRLGYGIYVDVNKE